MTIGKTIALTRWTFVGKGTLIIVFFWSVFSKCLMFKIGDKLQAGPIQTKSPNFNTFKLSSLFKLQVSNTSLLNVGTVWYLRSPELVHLITERVHPLTITSAFPPAPNACQPSFYYQSISIFFCNFLDQSGFSLGKV